MQLYGAREIFHSTVTSDMFRLDARLESIFSYHIADPFALCLAVINIFTTLYYFKGRINAVNSPQQSRLVTGL